MSGALTRGCACELLLMAFSLVGAVQTAQEGGGGTITFTLNGVSAGNGIVVGVVWEPAVTITSVTCSGESNLTLGTQRDHAATGHSHQFAWLGNVTTGGNKTVTVNFSSSPGTAGAGYAAALAGGDTADIFDAEQWATGTGTALSVGITTAADGAALFAIASSDGGDQSAGTGFTVITLVDVSWYDNGEYDLDAGSAGAKTVTMTAGSGQWGISAVALNAAAVSAPVAFGRRVFVLP
jgi:hypothetical protein